MLDLEDNLWAKETLKKLDFFSHCAGDDIALLAESLEKHRYRKETVILFQGEISNRFFLIKKGTVSVWKTAGDNKKMVAELGPGSYFGEISLMTPSGATATVKAQTDAEILSLAFEDFEVAFHQDPDQLESIRKKIEERKQNQISPSK